MDESDEDQFALENESMDEVHEVEGEWVDSTDTSAPPIQEQGARGRNRPRLGSDGSDSSDGNESDASDDFNGGSSSSSSSSGDERGSRADDRRAHSPRVSHTRRRASDDDDDDEPPEIPGSPMRSASVVASDGGRMNRLSDLDISKCGEDSRYRNQQQKGASSTDILTISHKSDGSEAEEDDDYETNEREAPRAMEFHASSSSSDSEHDLEGFGADEEEENNQEEKRYRGQTHESKAHPYHDRPKTAAKDLEPYRELVPKAYYEQLVQDAPPAAKATSKIQKSPSIIHSGSTQSAPPSKFKMRVPQEIEALFHLVDEFKPDIQEIPIRLQPFIPDYVPAIGVPFDGIQIPRPDGKRDESGIGFVRESSAQSSAAELELLLSTTAKKKQRMRDEQSVERVHGIEDALHRPREIDQWIASVAKVQASKPPPQVLYKKPMPALTTLMELWPEEFEVYLATQPELSVSRLDVSLPELVRIVCGMVDIPVYEGLHVHSLHLLFSLYHEVVMYEGEMQRNTR